MESEQRGALPSSVAVRPHTRYVTFEKKAYVIGGVASHVNYNVHNNSLHNLKRGLAERVFYVKGQDGTLVPPPAPLPGVYTQLARFTGKLRQHLPPTTPVSREEFAMMYRGRKQLRYLEAVESLQAKALEARDAWVMTFLKAEKINFTAKRDPAPRVIQPRQPRYNVEVGRYLKPAESYVYRAIACVFGGTTVTKGLNAAEVGSCISSKWEGLKHPVAVGLDASRFDQHVSVPALEWEHSVYNHMFKSQELKELLKMQLVNRGIARAKDGTVKYSVEGRRMSGDINTALGNCLLMCALVWTYMKSKKIRPVLVNNGDDCVCFMEARCLGRFMDGLKEWFLEMGFTMTVEKPCYELEEIEFCQGKVIITDEGPLMVRNVMNALAKDSTCLIPIDSRKGFERWVNSVGCCGESLCGGVPVMQSFYRMYKRVTPPKKKSSIDYPFIESGMSYLASRMTRTDRPISEQTRYSFYLAFGILPDAQVELEKYFDRTTLQYSKATPIECFPQHSASSLPLSLHLLLSSVIPPGPSHP